MAQEPAVVHRHDAGAVLGRHDVVGAVDDLGHRSPSDRAAATATRAHDVRGDDARHRQAAVARLRRRPEAHDVRIELDVVAAGERVDAGPRGDADAGAVAEQRSDVERDSERRIDR